MCTLVASLSLHEFLMTCSYLTIPTHTYHTPFLLHTTGVLADVSPTLGSTQAVVTERASNPQVGFDPTSVNATINDSKYNTDVSLENFSGHSTVKFMFLSLFSLFLPFSFFPLLPSSSLLLPHPSSSLLPLFLPPPSSPSSSLLPPPPPPLSFLIPTSTSHPHTAALDTNVDLIVTRQGLLGEIQVSWTAGLPSSPLAAGSIIPSTGTLTLGPNNGSTVISLTVSCLEHHMHRCTAVGLV